MRRLLLNNLTLIFLLLISINKLKAQDNYEIQVYGSETVEKGRTMLELHSNFTLKGNQSVSNGEFPTNHVEHETIEVTHGWTTWFETGFYFFNSIGDGNRTAYVGSHIRPRIAAPESWGWPVGVSISTEFGFQKSAFSANTSTLEIRPIIDKKWQKLYLSVNPTLEKSFKGPDQNRGFTFSPNVKGSYDLTKVIALGLEYYGSTGPFFHYDAYRMQDHQLYLATDLNFDPAWEFNAGLGYGFPQRSDKEILKIIIGRRF